MVLSDLKPVGQAPPHFPTATPVPRRDTETQLYNLALLADATADADSEYGPPYHSIANLNDGFFGDGASWIPKDSSPGGQGPGHPNDQHWAAIDLGDVYWIRKVVVSNGYYDRAPKNFRIEYQRSPADPWQLLGQSDEPLYASTGAHRAFQVAHAVEARTIRVFITETAGISYQLFQPRLCEIQIYGDTTP